MPETNPKSYQCRHIFADGHRCGSKSLRNEEFCYYHHTTRKPTPRPEASPGTATFDLAFPEDRAAIQSNIGEILRRLATNTIDVRRAGLLLYGLQIASLNLPRTQFGRNPDDDAFHDVVEEVIEHPTLGPLAPPAEFIHPMDQRPETVVQQLLRELGDDDDQGDQINIQAAAKPAEESSQTTGAPPSRQDSGVSSEARPQPLPQPHKPQAPHRREGGRDVTDYKGFSGQWCFGYFRANPGRTSGYSFAQNPARSVVVCNAR